MVWEGKGGEGGEDKGGIGDVLSFFNCWFSIDGLFLIFCLLYGVGEEC